MNDAASDKEDERPVLVLHIIFEDREITAVDLLPDERQISGDSAKDSD